LQVLAPYAIKLGLDQGAPVLKHVVEVFNGEGDLLELVDSLIEPIRYRFTTDVNLVDNL